MTKKFQFVTKQFIRFLLLLSLTFTALNIQVRTAAASPGVDGSRTISASGEVINRYAPVTAITGDIITVTDINLLDDNASNHYDHTDITTGDMLLIYQAQGATFADSDDIPSYGAFNINAAGTYEFVSVVSVAVNDITIDATNTAPYSCGGLSGTYDTTDGNVQVVRVPQYTNLTITGSGSIVADDWNGITGGIVSVLVQSTMTLNGSIDVSGQGFRGGVVKTNNISDLPGTTIFRSPFANEGGEKGESILGFQAEYNTNNGGMGRGAPANGGGGGNAHNAGGGGGANGDNGGTWTGRGLPDTSNTNWDPAWDLDDGMDDGIGDPLPTYFIGGAGGGRGGYSYADADQDPTTVPPGDPSWNSGIFPDGDSHRNVGGYGGHPVTNNPASQLFFGGGGGAADANNNQSNSGGDGGGLVVVVAFTLNGTGQILANGDSVLDTTGPNYADGNSGGGAGGTVVIGSSSATGVTITANGGAGGSVDDPAGVNPGCFAGGPGSACTVGPGGGGGGGYVHVNTASGSLTTSVNGGANGIDTSTYVDEFPPDGATAGYDGATSTAAFAFPGCSSPTAINLLNASSGSSASNVIVISVFLSVIVIAITVLVWRRKPLPTA